jgi:benzoyl-CoA reductase/2-hydroxyglutaryl-CoA dehydratase subunit BcrC/BadD/HgdB
VSAFIAQREPLAGARLLVKGSCVDHTGLHRAIESHGAVVTAEDDWWGSRSAGRDVKIGGDLLRNLFAKYYLDSPSPRVFPPERSESWFRREALRHIDGVVFYLPPDEDVLGWDYPRQRDFLAERDIPHLLVRDEMCAEATPKLQEEIERFVAGLRKAEKPKGSQAI